MFDSHETLKELENPERSEADIAESNAMLNNIYNFDTAMHQNDFDAWKAELGGGDDLSDPGVTDRNRNGVDVSSIDTAVADRTNLGQNTAERRQHIAEAHDTLHNNDSLEQRHFNEQVEDIASDVERNIGELGGGTVERNDIAARLEGEMIQDTLDGDDPEGANSNINTDDLNEARRAVEAAFVLEELQEGNVEQLNRMNNSTAEKVVAYEQNISENGPASNEKLARLGKQIEQGVVAGDTGETVHYVGQDGELHKVEKNNRARSVAESWIDGNWNEGSDIDHATRDKAFYYLETARERENLNDPEVRQRVIARVEQMVTRDQHDSDRKVHDGA